MGIHSEIWIYKLHVGGCVQATVTGMNMFEKQLMYSRKWLVGGRVTKTKIHLD